MKSPRYLLIAPQGLGDSLEATPLLPALRACSEDAVIDVVVTRPGPRELFEGLAKYVDEVIYLPYWEGGAAKFVGALLGKAWRKHYAATFLSYPSARPEYQLLSRAFPSRRRIAHRYEKPTPANLLWLNTDLVPITQAHNVLRNFDLLRAYGFQPEAPASYIVPENWKVDPAQRAANRVAVHVGTIKHDGREARRWPLENFFDICRHLLNRNFDVTLVMGPDEREETHEIHGRLPRTSIFEGSLQSVAQFLSASRLVLTNDSGIGHLAAGVGTTVLSLFGPTPLDFAPFGPSAFPLRPSNCPPCFDVRSLNMSCKLNIDFACLRRDLSVEIVRDTIDRLLAADAT